MDKIQTYKEMYIANSAVYYYEYNAPSGNKINVPRANSAYEMMQVARDKLKALGFEGEIADDRGVVYGRV